VVRIAYLGNFQPSHSTETHVAASLEALGHEVLRVQEGVIRATEVPDFIGDIRLVWWTQTFGLAESGGTFDDRVRMVETFRDRGVTTVSFHLDRWWGLARQDQVERGEAFFRTDHVFTADGGHDEDWRRSSVNHHWSPPAVFHAEAHDGSLRQEFACDIAFVGSWRHYGHEEWWPRRLELLEHLRRRYGGRFRCFPEDSVTVRGSALNDLYASVKVVVGDSCLVGAPSRYWSDRIPETTGRGGFLLHPEVEGLEEVHAFVPTWPFGDWRQLDMLIDQFLLNDALREQARVLAAEETRRGNTYKHRVAKVLSIVETGVTV
jgi:hypothetical protein